MFIQKEREFMRSTKNYGRIHFSQQFWRSCSQLLASIDINSYSKANKYDSFHINVRSIIYIFIYIIDPMFISSTKYRSYAIKEPFRHRPTFIAFYRRKEGGTKNYGFYYHCVILETRVYILLIKDKF